MTYIQLTEQQEYNFTPQDFGFPPGATEEEYKNYYVKLFSPGSRGEYRVNGYPVYQYAYYPFYVWFGNISMLSFYSYELVIDYNGQFNIEITYQIVRRKFENIFVTSIQEQANTYPSLINVNLQNFSPVSVSVELNGVVHTYFEDMVVYVANPANKIVSLILGDWGSLVMSSSSMKFSDAGVEMTSSNANSNLTYKPQTINANAQYWTGGNDEWDLLDLEADQASYWWINSTGQLNTLNEFLNFSPINGFWKLYFYDNSSGDSGSIADWKIKFTNAAGDTRTFTTEKLLPESTGAVEIIDVIIYKVNNPPSHSYSSLDSCFARSSTGFCIYINDDGGYSGFVTTTLSCSSGTFGLNLSYASQAAAAGTTFEGNNTDSVTINGPLQWVSNFLCSVIYYSPQGALPIEPIVNCSITTTDDGSGGPGGVQTTTDTFTIPIIFPGPPRGVPFDVFINRGDSIIIPGSQIMMIDDETDGVTSSFLGIFVTTIPSLGVLTCFGVPVQVNQFILKTDLDQDCLSFEYLEEGPEDVNLFFSFLVVNNVDTNYYGGGTNTATSATTVTIKCFGNYTGPANLTFTPFSTVEGREIIIGAGNFGYDIADNLIEEFGSIECLSLPSEGELRYADFPIGVGDIFPVSGRMLTYVPPVNVMNTTSISFGLRFTVSEAKLKNVVQFRPKESGIYINQTYNYSLGQYTGQAQPYPSLQYLTSSLTGIEDVNVVINNLSYYSMNKLRIDIYRPDTPDDVGCRLYYENHQGYASDIGPPWNGYQFGEAPFLNYYYDDSALGYAPTTYTSGTYKPSPGTSTPEPPLFTSLSALNSPSAPLGGWWALELSTGFYAYYGGYLGEWGVDIVSPKVTGALPTSVDIFCTGVVEPVNEAPRIVSSSVLQAFAETSTFVDGLLLVDADQAPANVLIDIECTNGLMEFVDTYGAALTGNNSNQLSLSGSFLQAKQAIESLNNFRYTGVLGFEGRDSIKFSVYSPDPSTGLLSVLRETELLVVIKTSQIIKGNILAPTYVKHGQARDTAIKIYWNDPRENGDYWEGGTFVSASPKLFPDFQGQLIAYLTYENDQFRPYLLCGHNSGSGLEWKEVTGRGTVQSTSIDARTNTQYDPQWETNCNPPWICS